MSSRYPAELPEMLITKEEEVANMEPNTRLKI
jgi:hypothetical protein